MNKKIILMLFVIVIIAISTVTCVSAIGSPDDLHSSNSIDVKNGKLIDTAHDDKEIGTVTPLNSSSEGEDLIYSYDANAIKQYISDNPLVIQYDVMDNTDSTHDGIYFMFAHDGDIFLAFVPGENMNGMLKRMTNFCKDNGILK